MQGLEGKVVVVSGADRGLTVMASALIGLNREARGHADGFRTTILVGLAACVSMIQANLLLSLAGKTSASFAVADVLRFPLGVLTGVGFIRGGTILKRGSLVLGVTTAATLWLVTAIELCFGGGQWIVGAAGTLLAVFTLWALRWLDMRIPREHRALLAIDAPKDWAAVPNEIDRILRPRGYRVQFMRADKTDQSFKAMFYLAAAVINSRESPQALERCIPPAA